jgi:hypothetical protein
LVRSPFQELELADGETVNVRCWPNGRLFNGLFMATVGRTRYIGVEVSRATGTSPGWDTPVA